MIRNQIQKIVDSLPEEELESIYFFILPIQKKYEFKQFIREKNVEISELIHYEADEIRDLWDNTFAKNISEELKGKIHYEQYKWHMFSFELQQCLTHEDAREAFDNSSKDELYVMYEGLPIVFLYKNVNNLVSKDFDSQKDIYIFDKNFTWTYVHTHESMCGPYFYEII